jgi:hypothetical protein
LPGQGGVKRPGHGQDASSPNGMTPQLGRGRGCDSARLAVAVPHHAAMSGVGMPSTRAPACSLTSVSLVTVPVPPTQLRFGDLQLGRTESFPSCASAAVLLAPAGRPWARRGPLAARLGQPTDPTRTHAGAHRYATPRATAAPACSGRPRLSQRPGWRGSSGTVSSPRRASEGLLSARPRGAPSRAVNGLSPPSAGEKDGLLD